MRRRRLSRVKLFFAGLLLAGNLVLLPQGAHRGAGTAAGTIPAPVAAVTDVIEELLGVQEAPRPDEVARLRAAPERADTR